MAERVETRDAYGQALLILGHQRPDVVVLDADLYKSTRTDGFRQTFPQRFLDMGIAEADMVSTSAGLAAAGLVPFCNSFAVFLTGRAYDQIRVQIAYPSLPVRLIGSSAGLTHGSDGASHQALEDISLMRVLPNMTVVVPSDGVETEKATWAIADYPGPVYMRLSRYPSPQLHDRAYRFEIGKIDQLRDGDDVALLGTGIMTAVMVEAADLLAHDGIRASVLNVHTIKPLDRKVLEAVAHRVPLVVTAEDHQACGGLGSAVAEVLSEGGFARQLRLGVNDQFGESGLADELLEKHGLTSRRIAGLVVQSLGKLA
jgi:transketolase